MNKYVVLYYAPISAMEMVENANPGGNESRHGTVDSVDGSLRRCPG